MIDFLIIKFLKNHIFCENNIHQSHEKSLVKYLKLSNGLFIPITSVKRLYIREKFKASKGSACSNVSLVREGRDPSDATRTLLFRDNRSRDQNNLSAH